MKLSLCLATHNEENNLAGCLESVKALANEIIIVDGSSTDKTVEIAKKYGARVIVTDNPSMFHINKQKALDAAKGEWILQLDADERVSSELAEEIEKIIDMNREELEEYQQHLPERKLFLRHQNVIVSDRRKRGNLTLNKIASSSATPRNDNETIVAFYIPRLNNFLGKFLRHGGQYPDGAIRLIKNGKAHFPCKDVHEVMQVDGKVGWLQNPLLHYSDPTFSRYLNRWHRYTSLEAKKLVDNKEDCSFINYVFLKPLTTFFLMYFRHKGFMDGLAGLIFAFFSSIRFIAIYFKFKRLP